jgi:LAO/AO transport system kinase
MPSLSTPRLAQRAARLTLAAYADDILGWNRAILARAITLIESNRPDHQEMAQELLERLLPHTGRSIRVGLTGVPGAGKSALIEALGCRLTAAGHRLAVLAIDPSSVRSGGSLLGDKTRMVRLSADPNAFIRPSPSGGALGGVARKTRETMLVCEAAGCDVVLIETVGVGQSEVSVASMTDFLLVLMVAGAGDELQGIKRGLLELADMIAITKADGENVNRANLAASKYAFAMRLLRGGEQPPVVTCSSLDGSGIDDIWRIIVERTRERERSGALEAQRSAQAAKWMWSLVDEQIRETMQQTEAIRRVAEDAERDVRIGTLSPVLGAQAIVRALRSSGMSGWGRADEPACAEAAS